MIIIKMNILKTPKKILIIGKGKNYFFHPHQHLVSFIIRIIEYIPKNSFIFGIDEENWNKSIAKRIDTRELENTAHKRILNMIDLKENYSFRWKKEWWRGWSFCKKIS